MWTHRQVSPFTSFLPVLTRKTTEQHAILPPWYSAFPWMSCTLHFLVARYAFKPWEDVYITPFGTMVLFPFPPERLLSPTVRFWRILMKTPSQDFFLVVALIPFPRWIYEIRGYSQQHSLSGMKAHASNHWMIFRITTSLNASPLLVRRQVRKIELFLSEVFSITDFRQCLEIGNLIQVCRPENWGPIVF